MSRRWRAWAAPYAHAIRPSELGWLSSEKLALFVAPVELLREAWAGLSGDQRCRVAARAAHHGDAALLQWARSQGCLWIANTSKAAARSGHLAVLQWACAQGCPWDLWTCATAARDGHLGGAAVGTRLRLPVECRMV